MYYRISKNENNLFFGKKNRPGVGSDLKATCICKNQILTKISEFTVLHTYPKA